MLKRHPFLISVVVLLVASLACSQAAPAVPPPDSNALNTSIAQTVAARQTDVALSVPTAIATLTPTPETPTSTLEPTLTVTPDYTPTSSIPLISVSVDTNCRTGPGAIFQKVGILLVGETAEIVGREPRGEYWYIRNPDQGIENCWVWGEYATVTGNTLFLVYLSPPAPPASSFTLSFQGLETCTVWWADFKLVNSSGAPFKSISLTLRDADTNTVASLAENRFTNKDACDPPKITDSLISGGTLTVSSPPLGYNPSGHNLNAKITVCTDADQKGTCLTQELNFKP